MAVSKERAQKVADYANRYGIAKASARFNIGTDSVERYMLLAMGGVYNSGAGSVTYTTDDDAPVLIMPDLHAPYNHPQAIEFLKWVYESRGCGSAVSVGDMFDFHSMSRHISETDAFNAKREYEKALQFVDELSEVFPEGDLVLGNHDLIPQRQMKELGLLSTMLKDDNELYGLPDGWNIHPLYHVIKPNSWNVLVEHGIGSAGKYGCANTAKEKRCSYVQGHVHSAAAVIYSTNHASTIFGMNVGCLVDSSSLAMRYGKYGIKKGVIGCGVVYSGEHAEFVPMSTYLSQ